MHIRPDPDPAVLKHEEDFRETERIGKIIVRLLVQQNQLNEN
jgi:hypothetical protein